MWAFFAVLYGLCLVFTGLCAWIGKQQDARILWLVQATAWTTSWIVEILTTPGAHRVFFWSTFDLFVCATLFYAAHKFHSKLLWRGLVCYSVMLFSYGVNTISEIVGTNTWSYFIHHNAIMVMNYLVLGFILCRVSRELVEFGKCRLGDARGYLHNAWHYLGRLFVEKDK